MEVHMKKTAFAALIAAAVLALPCVGAARADRDLTYRENEIWNGAIRFLRVDSGFKIVEKDRDAGYVLFEYKDGTAPHSASFEMVKAVKEGRSYVRARIQIPEMPRYVEVVLIDKLIRKLADEYGDPPPAPLIQPEAKPAAAASAKAGEGDKGAPQATGKPASDGEQDPEAQDEHDLEVTEDDLAKTGQEG
jgi:hypothetical protein